LFFGKWKVLVDGFIAELQSMAERQLPAWMDYIYKLDTAGPGALMTEAEHVSELPLPLI